jgi:hypothetical protein
VSLMFTILFSGMVAFGAAYAMAEDDRSGARSPPSDGEQSARSIACPVVKLSNGEFECHEITVNWPHHIFVSSDFKAVGAF